MSRTAGPTEPLRIGSSMDLPPTLRVAEAVAGGSAVFSLLARVAEVGVIERLPYTAYKRSRTAIWLLQCITQGKSKPGERQAGKSLLRILVAERLAVLIVSKKFAIAAEIDDRPQRPLGIVFGHVVLKLLAEARCGRAMGRALVENPLDMGGEGHVRQHLVAEHLLALIDIHVDEALAKGRELDVALFELGKPQQLQGLAKREQFVDFELQRVGEMREVRLSVIGRSGDLLEHASKRVGRDARQGEPKAGRGRGFARRRFCRVRPLGHQRVDLLDQVPEPGVQAIAWVGKGDRNLGGDAAWIG